MRDPFLWCGYYLAAFLALRLGARFALRAVRFFATFFTPVFLVFLLAGLRADLTFALPTFFFVADFAFAMMLYPSIVNN